MKNKLLIERFQKLAGIKSVNEGFTKKEWDIDWKLPEDNLFNVDKTSNAVDNRWKALQFLLKSKPKELQAFDNDDEHPALNMSYDELMRWYNTIEFESVNEDIQDGWSQYLIKIDPKEIEENEWRAADMEAALAGYYNLESTTFQKDNNTGKPGHIEITKIKSSVNEAAINEEGIEPSPSGWYSVVKVGFDQWGEFGEVESFITKSPEKYADVVDPDFPDPVYEITPIEVK